MKVLVCGGRDYTNRERLFEVLTALEPKVVIHGGAQGADLLAHAWAVSYSVPVWAFYAEWDKHGKSAGPIRNQRMLKEGEPDVVVAFPGGRGTAHMVRIAKDAGIEVHEIK